VREEGVEPSRPFGHRILRLLRPGTDPAATCRPVSSDVVLCHPVSFRREQTVSKGESPATVLTLRVRGAQSADRDGDGGLTRPGRAATSYHLQNKRGGNASIVQGEMCLVQRMAPRDTGPTSSDLWRHEQRRSALDEDRYRRWLRSSRTGGSKVSLQCQRWPHLLR